MAAVLAPQALARGRQGSGPESGGTLSLDPEPWGAGPGPRCADPPEALPVPAPAPARRVVRRAANPLQPPGRHGDAVAPKSARLAEPAEQPGRGAGSSRASRQRDAAQRGQRPCSTSSQVGGRVG